VVVTKSTVPVGTGDRIAGAARRRRAPEGVSVASNPEFLREGAAIADFKHPDRILVGAEDERRARCCGNLPAACSSTGRRSCSPAGAPPS
jgi:UDP-glucose 6-dehydrogenase